MVEQSINMKISKEAKIAFWTPAAFFIVALLRHVYVYINRAALCEYRQGLYIASYYQCPLDIYTIVPSALGVVASLVAYIFIVFSVYRRSITAKVLYLRLVYIILAFVLFFVFALALLLITKLLGVLLLTLIIT